MKKIKICVVFILITSVLCSFGIGQALSSSYASATDTENNDNPAEAQAIQVDTIVTGDLGSAKGNFKDYVDTYKVTLTGNGVLSVTVSMDASLKDIITSITSGTGAGYISLDGDGTITRALGVGTYYIDLNDTAVGKYALTVAFSPQGLAEDTEINNTYEQAQVIQLNETITGNLGYLTQRVRSSGDTDNIDKYKFTLPSKGKFKLSISCDASLKEIITGVSNGQGSGFGSFDNFGSKEFELDAGTYYIDINSYSNSYGGYTLTNSFTSTASPAPTPKPTSTPTPEPAQTNDDSEESDDVLTSLAVTPANIVIDAGKTLQLKASAKYSSGLVEDVTEFVEWHAENKKIVTVDENGLLKAVGAGSTIVVAKLEGKSFIVNAKVKPVVVEKKVSKITVQRATVYLKVGQQGSNIITCLFVDKTKQNVTAKAVFTSSNKSIVSIYKNGYFKAMKVGTVKVQVTYKGAKTSFKVVVK